MAASSFTHTSDLSQFFTRAENRVRVREHFAVWQSKLGIHGSITWGKVTDEDVVEMTDVFDAVLHSPLARQPSLIDIRALESVSVTAFDRWVKTMTDRQGAWLPRAGRQAIIHASTFPAATMLGALQMTAKGYELKLFDDAVAAFKWCGVPKAEPEYSALRASLLDPPDIIRRVRTALAEHGKPLSVAGLARKLGLSTRSLQRHLAAAGSSVRMERTAHVLARAERLLAGTDLDLAAIAAMLGLSSPAHLVTLFKTERKTTPDAWRRAAR